MIYIRHGQCKYLVGSTCMKVHAFAMLSSLCLKLTYRHIYISSTHNVTTQFTDCAPLICLFTSLLTSSGWYAQTWALRWVCMAVSTPVPVTNRTLAYRSLESGLRPRDLKIDRRRPRTVRPPRRFRRVHTASGTQTVLP